MANTGDAPVEETVTETPAPKKSRTITVTPPTGVVDKDGNPVEANIVGQLQEFSARADGTYFCEFVRLPVKAKDAYLVGSLVYVADADSDTWEDAVFSKCRADNLIEDSTALVDGKVDWKSLLGKEPSDGDPDAGYFAITLDKRVTNPSEDVDPITDGFQNIAVLVDPKTQKKEWQQVVREDYSFLPQGASLPAGVELDLHGRPRATNFGADLAGVDAILLAAAKSYFPLANDGSAVFGSYIKDVLTDADYDEAVKEAFKAETEVSPDKFTEDAQAHLVRAALNLLNAAVATKYDRSKDNEYPTKNPSIDDAREGYTDFERGVNQSVGFVPARDAAQQTDGYPFDDVGQDDDGVFLGSAVGTDADGNQYPKKSDLYPSTKPVPLRG